MKSKEVRCWKCLKDLSHARYRSGTWTHGPLECVDEMQKRVELAEKRLSRLKKKHEVAVEALTYLDEVLADHQDESARGIVLEAFKGMKR